MSGRTWVGHNVRGSASGKPRTIPLNALYVSATIAANRERGLDIKVPQNKGEIMLSF